MKIPAQVRHALFVGAVSTGSLLASTAHAAWSDDKAAFVIHNAYHILLHEIGHALIDQFQLPVIGQEEDAVDAFATLEVVNGFNEPAEILVDAALAMLVAHEQIEESGDGFDYYGEHDLDIQRAYRIICHAYGLEQGAFRGIAREFEFDRERLESCTYDGQLMAESWYGLTDDYRLEKGESLADVVVSFDPDGLSPELRNVITDWGLVEDMTGYLEEEFAWPQTVTLRFEACGEANAYYDPADVSITFCHEFFDDLAESADVLLAE